MFFRGQSSLQYLLTYGFVFIIAVVVGVVAYSWGIFSPSAPTERIITGLLHFQIIEFSLDENGTMLLDLGNRYGKTVGISYVNVITGGLSSTTQPANFMLGPDEETGVFSLSGLAQMRGGTRYTAEIIVGYNDTVSDLSHTDSGTLQGIVKGEATTGGNYSKPPSVILSTNTSSVNQRGNIEIRAWVVAGSNPIIDRVLFEVTYPNSSEVNYTALNNTASNFTYAFGHTSAIGKYSIRAFANDTSGKMNDSERTSFQVNDSEPPDVKNLGTNVSSLNQSQSILISANVTEDINSNISVVRFEITFPNSSKMNYNTVNNTASNFTLRFNDTAQTGGYQARVYANDTNNNVNGSETVNFTVGVPSVPGNIIIPFSNPANYSFNNTTMNVSGGYAFLKNVSGIFLLRMQADFDSGNYTNTTFNSTSSAIILAAGNRTGTYLSPALNASGLARWLNFSWWENAPYGEEMPRNRTVEQVPGGANMSSNTLLFHFNNDSGFGESTTRFYDFSGLGNNGSCSGTACPAQVPGILRRASSFDGTNDYITVPDSNSLDFRNLTILAWVNPNTTTSTYCVIGKGRNDNDDNFELFIQNDEVLFEWYNTTLYRNNTTNMNLTAGNWTHIGVTVNGTKLSFYKNGVLIENITMARGLVPNNRALWVGRQNYGSSNHYFRGKLDELALFNRSLAQEEIRNIYYRGALNLTFQIRTSGNNISWGTFSGPGNNTSAHYTNTSYTLTNMSNESYLQFMGTFRSMLANETPYLRNVSVGYSHMTASAITTETFQPATVSQWTFFKENATLSGQGISYRLSDDDGATWRYWNGSAWVSALLAGNWNNASVVNSSIGSFPTASGKIMVRALLNTSGLVTPVLDSLEIGYMT